MKTTTSPLYRASWSIDGSLDLAQCGQGETSQRLESAVADANHVARAPGRSAKSVTILRDDRGTDHPDNAGKFFLFKIIK